MKNNLVKNTTIYSIGNILPQAASFILLPIYTRYLSPEDYGIINSLAVFQTILAVLFSFGIERSIYRLYYDYKSEEEKKKFIGTILSSILVLSLIMMGLIFLSHSLVGKIYSSIPFHPFYTLTIFTCFFSVFSLIPKIHFQLKGDSVSFIIISIIQFVINNSLIIWLVVYDGQKALGVLNANLYEALFLIPYFIYISLKIAKITFDYKIFKSCLLFSLPMIPGLISAWVLNLSDRIFIEKYFSLEEVGIYSLGYKIGGLILVVTSSFFKAYNPFFYEKANSENQEKAKQTLYNTNLIFIVGILFFSFLLAFFAKPIVALFFDARYQEAYKVIPIIVLAYFVSQTNGLLNLFYYQQKKTKMVMYLILGSAGLNVLLNFLLIPKFGMHGAAYSTLISYSTLFLLQYKISKNYYFVPFNWKILIPAVIILICTYLLFDLVIDFGNITNLIIKVIFVLSVVGLFYFYQKNSLIKVVKETFLK